MTDVQESPEWTAFHASRRGGLTDNKLVSCASATTPWPKKPEDQLEAEEELLQRLVDLNHQRATEEAKDNICWLRPDYQASQESATQEELATGEAETTASRRSGPDPKPKMKLVWPKGLQTQIRVVRNHLATGPMNAQTLAVHFKRKPKKSIAQVLEALTEIGMVEIDDALVCWLHEG